MPFTLADIPDQTGKLAVITGATGGLGYETALALAGAGASVVLTGRNATKGTDALAGIRAVHPKADITFEMLDLASLSAVREFAENFAQRHDRLDILVNNAGVMAPPKRQLTADGFELQFGTNYLAHFALTAHLLPLLQAGQARVVSLSSIAARRGSIAFDDLQAKRGYRPFTSYSQSKLAMLMFALELQRRSDAGGWGLRSIAAHPGVASTALIANGPAQDGGVVAALTAFSRPVLNLFGQSPADGALPQIFAATAPGAVAGGYYGSTGFMEMKGPVGIANTPRQALDRDVARQLWTVSEDLLKIWFPTLAAAA